MVASDSQIEKMLAEAPGPINFTVFLTLFGNTLVVNFLLVLVILHI